ncbi:hypothetical protein [Marinobacter sp.]|uniref:hypothetical protein n=1 Tax=Marinobacter sp. TaxID=50741 RepID=UPI001B4957EE|nr:hypothetical protein [Marinobacter sp.]MBQ0834451.1 hypothetical protein [Marinobacter sp.]
MKSLDWGQSPVDVKGNTPLFVDLLEVSEANAAAYQAGNWIAAVDAWDYCDGTLLEEMLRRHPIPFELQPVIANIVSGKRTQKRKAAARLKVPAAHRMYFAAWYAHYKRNTIDAGLMRRLIPDYHEIADRDGKEVAEMREELLQAAREFKSEIADHAQISVETLENLYETLMKKIKNYPEI